MTGCISVRHPAGISAVDTGSAGPTGLNVKSAKQCSPCETQTRSRPFAALCQSNAAISLGMAQFFRPFTTLAWVETKIRVIEVNCCCWWRNLPGIKSNSSYGPTLDW